jgi:hypothetical protein
MIHISAEPLVQRRIGSIQALVVGQFVEVPGVERCGAADEFMSTSLS